MVNERMIDYASITYKFLNISKVSLLEKKRYLNLLEMTDEYKSLLNLSESTIYNFGLPKNFYKNWFKNNFKLKPTSSDFQDLLEEIEKLYMCLIEDNFKFEELEDKAYYIRMFQLSTATKKDIEFITELGLKFITSTDELANIPLGIYHILVAARLESADALFHLGYFLIHGIGLEEDHDLSFRLWDYARSKGQADAHYNVGIIYLNGLNQNYQKDIEKATECFIQGMILDHSKSVNLLKKLAKDNEYIKYDIISKSYKYLNVERNKLIKLIDKKNLYNTWYYNIIYIGVSDRLLNAWYYSQKEEPNIIRNLDKNTYLLDRIRIITLYVDKNNKEITTEDNEDIENIHKELIIFKNSKDKIKLHILGYFYIQPFYKYRNLNLGFYYINKSARLGYVKAITDLGSLYYYGFGIDKNINKAHGLYFEAKELGCLDAQYLLACSYLRNFKSRKKEEIAFELILNGKQKGHQKSIAKYSEWLK